MIKKIIKNSGELIIYTSKKGGVELRADVGNETIWATQAQIAELFGIDRSVVTKHINNVFGDKELDNESNVQKMHIPNSDKPVAYYSLDIILAVGYRTNSTKAIKFRQWATKILKEYLLKGIVVNTERIKKLPNRILFDLDEKLSFIQRTLEKRELDKDEENSLLAVIHDYANSWKFLKEYDEGELKLHRSKNKEKQKLEYDFVRQVLDTMRNELMAKEQASELFATERDQTFQGILKTIYQTFGGKELYTSLEEKAAHLLYFIIKDHPFSDGNKRVGSFLFISFLKLNRILTRPSGEKKINDNTLVALALLIAESDPKDKEIMVMLTTNLLI